MKLAILLSAVLAASASQTPAPSSQPAPKVPVEFSSLPVIDPPDRPGAWSIVVAKRGGIAAFGTAFVTTTSAGAVTCGGQTVPCRSTLERSELNSLSALIPRALPGFEGLNASGCSNCARTFVVLSRRDEAGQLQRLTASWDMTTQLKVPADLARLASTTTANALRRNH